MADSIPRCMSAALIQKLHALAERRCAHLKELCQSGRWTRYYSRDELVAHMSEADHMVRQWQQMIDGDRVPERETQPVHKPAIDIVPSAFAVFAASRRLAAGGR